MVAASSSPWMRETIIIKKINKCWYWWTKEMEEWTKTSKNVIYRQRRLTWLNIFVEFLREFTLNLKWVSWMRKKYIFANKKNLLTWTIFYNKHSRSLTSEIRYFKMFYHFSLYHGYYMHFDVRVHVDEFKYLFCGIHYSAYTSFILYLNFWCSNLHSIFN